MRLRRPNHRFSPTPQTDASPAHQRIAVLESEIRELRPTRISSAPPPPMTAPGAPTDRSARAVLVLGEMALHHLAIGELDEARRAVGDAVVLLEQVTDEGTIARASILLGEALLALDAPHHAEPRFARALTICERFGDRRLALRARIGLGRTLVALDDLVGVELLKRARLDGDGDPASLAKIDEAIRYAEKLFDTPRSVHTGYGRPVSIPPKPTT
jgi:hypothetical protein